MCDFRVHLFQGECSSVTTIGSHRIEGIGERKQSRAKWSLVTNESVRIALAIPTFMVMADDGRTVLQHGRAPYDLLADDSVLLQKQGLGWIEFSGLEKDPVGYSDLAYVVK